MANTELETYHKYSTANVEEESISDTFGSFTDYRHDTSMMSQTLGDMDLEILLSDDKLEETLSGNPKNWHWGQVQLWLHKKRLNKFVQVFDVKDEYNLKTGIEGEELLDITFEKLLDEYNTLETLDIENKEIAYNHPLIERLFREITKLEVQASDLNDNNTEKTTINDYIEMKRRINLFTTKWDKILWIKHYKDTNNCIPTKQEIFEELELSGSVASVYIQYYNHFDRFKKKDLNELLLDFNVYNDAIIWWFIIISSLKTYPSKSMWLIFGKVAEITPGSVAIELLEKYKFDLTRFDAIRLDQVCQNIVIGSQFPVCAALRIAKWFNDRAEYDISRSSHFTDIAQSYIDAANDYISFLESDHMACILLEVKSDIDDMSALDMALEYKLQSFVSNNRVERVTTSIMNNFQFLKPKNRDEAFEIDPLSLTLIWRKMWKKEFYLTPLGLYITTVVLYICYLALFTYLSIQQFGVYDKIEIEEILFWIFNSGYVLNEIQQIISTGAKKYISDATNRFDIIISAVFVTSLCMRCYALFKGSPNCGDIMDECWKSNRLNTAFIILWGIATITLWLRLINFCVLSHRLGPMVQMIFKMVDDIITFFEIMLVLFLGFTFALMFIMGSIHSDFETPIDSALTLFTAILGDFDFGAFADEEGTNQNLIYFGYGIMLLYLIIGSLVLLNLLIAMMATTYEHIDENATSAIIYARFQLALNLDADASFMPPPLNVLVMLLLIIFYVFDRTIEFVVRVCLCRDYSYDLAAIIMPGFLKERKLELDEQILWKNCSKTWTITTHRGPTKCKAFKYNAKLNKHYMNFYDTNGEPEDDTKWTGLAVSVRDDVTKKHCWLLDLMHLYEIGLIELSQFENIRVDTEWIKQAHDAIKNAKKNKSKSVYWICGYCRGYVKESKISIKHLGRLLNVNDIELKIINKVTPNVCPNCFRVRYERKRWEFVWEILSIWIFYVIVFPLFFILFGFILLLRMLGDPAEIGRNWELLKSITYNTEEQVVEKIKNDHKYEYVTYHYSDTQLIAKLNSLSAEHKLFDSKVRDIVWEKLFASKDAIDPFLLKNKINHYVMRISTEDELTPYEFFIDYINMQSLKQNDEYNLWFDYFQPISMTLFKQIQKLRADYLPLHLFARYPFDLQCLLDDFEQFYEQSLDHDKKSLKKCTKQDLIDALNKLKFLNCQNVEERQYILDSIEQNINEYQDEKKENDTIYDKFIKYCAEVTSLFQNTRKIKNMLRDVNRAIIERGAAAALFADQLYFLFDDIKNSTVALPFFNSMRTELVGDELKVELWTIRNTLQTLYFLNNATRKKILSENKKKYVNVEELLDIVFKLHSKDISDPEGITKRIYTKEQKDDESDDESLFSASNIKKMTLSAPRSITKKSISLLQENEDDDKTEETERIKEERQKLATERMELFRREEITASEVKMEVESIFNKLKQRRKLKITETTIDFYRREGLKNVRLLQDDESLRFIYEQLARYITFNPKQIKQQCDLNLLRKILCFTFKFDDKYKIDVETIPKMVTNNEKYIEQLYAHLNQIFTATLFPPSTKDKKSKMTLQDVVSIIMLYQRIFSVVQQKIIDSADEFVVNHDLFCKFVDPHYNLDAKDDEWSNKTRAASNLYQNVLDIQQHFVTLGQIYSTINVLLNDIHGMQCGELIRLLNHIGKRMTNDKKQCIEDRKKYVEELNLQNDIQPTYIMNESNELNVLNELDQEQEEEKEIKASSVKSVRLKSVSGASKLRKKNPSLQFHHVTGRMFVNFIRNIAKSFQNNIKSKEISDKLKNLKEEKEEEKDEYNNNKRQIIDTILDNTQFDIIFNDEKEDDDIDVIHEEKESKYNEEEEEKEEEDNKNLKKARYNVFDTVLSFNAKRITLQQLFSFSRQFRAFLRRNETINKLMKNYEKILISEDNAENIIININKLKKERIEHKEEKDFLNFKDKYFGQFKETQKMNLKDFIAEIEWLYEDTENEYVFCQRMYPFWGGKFINDIYEFMESTEQIQGIYELKCAEFGQLKYSLNVNDESAKKLFHIIRFKNRSLSWKQLYNYLIFILRMKYNVQKAILNTKEAEDTTVSSDGIQILLKISLNDSSKWLFHKVLFFNGSKVTWNQIRNYLKKMIAVRDDMRDFFVDKERDRNYHENKAEIIDEISKNIEENKDNNNLNQEEIMNLLKEIKKQNESMKTEINSLKEKLQNQN